MKTCIVKLFVTVTSLVVVVVFVTLSANVTRRAELYQAGAMSHAQPGAEILDSSYGAVMNNFYVK